MICSIFVLMTIQSPTPRFVSLKSNDISSRFAKVRGRSGRSYIVTEVPAYLLNTYHDCIAIAVVRDRIAGVWLACEGWRPGAEFAGPQIVAFEDHSSGLTRKPVRWFLHFLSGSDPNAVEDLRPDLSVSGHVDAPLSFEERRAA